MLGGGPDGVREASQPLLGNSGAIAGHSGGLCRVKNALLVVSLLFITSAEAGELQQASGVIHVGLQLPTKDNLSIASGDLVFHKHRWLGNVDWTWLVGVAVEHGNFDHVVERPTAIQHRCSL